MLPLPGGAELPRREEVVRMMDLSYAVKLLDVDDEVRAGAAGVVVDRHLLTGRVSEAVDAQIRPNFAMRFASSVTASREVLGIGQAQ